METGYYIIENEKYGSLLVVRTTHYDEIQDHEDITKLVPWILGVDLLKQLGLIKIGDL